MDEEDEDFVDIFADESDPLLCNTLEQDPEQDKPGVDKSEDKSEQKSDAKTAVTKTVDEVTALAELPEYTPIEKDKEQSMEVKEEMQKPCTAVTDIDSNLEPLSGEQKIDCSLSEIISDNIRRENRKRKFDPSLGETYNKRNYKQKYMIKNGVQLCLRPRKDIGKLSEQEAGDELARCLDEPKKILMQDTISTIGLDQALQLLAEATKIQEDGGITMQDGKVKRPGGVFISLLKKRITEEQMKSIFHRDKQLDSQNRKRKKRMKAKQDKAKVAQVKKRIDKELEKMEQKRWDELKKELPDVKLEKRYSLSDDEDNDFDLMEVDEIESPICGETITDSMATANENDSQDNSERSGNHNNGVDDNHNEEDNDNDILNGETAPLFT